MSSRTRRRGWLGRVEELEPRRLMAAAGALDPSFGGDGKTSIPDVDGNTLSAADVAVQADGKTVVVGTLTYPAFGQVLGHKFATARFNVDGSLDTTFAGTGIAVVQLSNSSTNPQSYARAVAIAPDGKIVVVGETYIREPNADAMDMAVLRYNPDGTLDDTFSDQGRLLADAGTAFAPPEVSDVAIAPDGRIIVVGKTPHTPGGIIPLPRETSDDFFVAFIDRNGGLDELSPLGFGGEDAARAVKIDGGGRIVVVGDVFTASSTASSTRVGLLRLSPVSEKFGYVRDLEEIFALPGRSRTYVQDLILQDGKIVIAGHTASPGGGLDFFVARFTEAGSLDTTFAGGVGYRITDLGGNDEVGGIIRTPVGSGFIVSGRSGSRLLVAVKYTDDGALDTTFGTGGIARITGFTGTDRQDGGVAFDEAPKVASGPGRRIVLAGGNAFFTARLLLEGARVVTVGALDSSAQEGTTDTGSLFVGRSERLPFPTRVFLNVSGTASITNDRSLPRDYNMPGLVIPIAGTPYVDIPAGETFVLLTLTPIKDSRAEGTETAVFAIAPRSSYEVGTPSSGTIRIADAPQLILSAVGTTTVTPPPPRVAAGRELRTVVSWTVPSGGWRGLSSVQLRLRDLGRRAAPVLLTFDEATNSFALDAAGARRVPVRLIPESSSFQAAGAASPTVTVTFAYRFTGAAARRRFVVEVAAGNDAGEFSGFTRLGRLFVSRAMPRKPAVFLPGG